MDNEVYDYNPDRLMTERTGHKIMEAVNNLAETMGGGSSSKDESSPVFIVNIVDHYPGDGEDPYAQEHLEVSDKVWMDATAGEIYNAISNNKLVFLVQKTEDVEEDVNYQDEPMTVHSISQGIGFIHIFIADADMFPNGVRIQVNYNGQFFSAKTLDDYPFCSGNK